MEFKFEFTGIAHIAPERLVAPAGEITHGMVVVVRTGHRGGAPHSEYIYCCLTEAHAAALAGVADGTHVVFVSASAIWTYTNEGLERQVVPAIACVASTVKIVRERRN
jgi:hypothetical protein